MRVRSQADIDSVFINCPFTADFRALFHSIVFTVLACGFRPRSALEASDCGDNRIDKISRLVRDSHYSIHDLSAVELDGVNHLPRFNMPFELGMVLGCKKVVGKNFARRPVLVMEKTQYTAQKCLSDIAGQDLKVHGGQVPKVIRIVRDWLIQESARDDIPGYLRIQKAFSEFYFVLPELCSGAGIELEGIGYSDFVRLSQTWLTEQNVRNAI